jgi:hypothetical protein
MIDKLAFAQKEGTSAVFAPAFASLTSFGQKGDKEQATPSVRKIDSSKNQGGKNLIRRYIILGERRLSNYIWAFIVFFGSCGFLLTGFSSYNQLNEISSETVSTIRLNLLPVIQDISFFPQGLLMSFYGSLGFLLSFYWGFNIFWNVGGGFNEFNKKEGKIRVFRWGYPGKNRRIDLSYSLKDVEAIKVEIKQGLDSQRTIYLKLKGKREIPLTGIGDPLTLKEIEKQASELANFLQVSLEGL